MFCENPRCQSWDCAKHGQLARKGRIGQYGHLEPVSLPIDMDELADLLVRSNYGVHRLLSALVRARERHAAAPSEDRLAREIKRLLQDGEF